MTDKPMTVGELIKEHEEDLKMAVEQAYSSIGKHSSLISPKINYESLEGALRVAIDNLEAIQWLLDGDGDGE
jgi:hypothetical protein